jgi:hypothetical protein
MKKLIYLIVLTLILGLVLTGCLLSNVGQVPDTSQSGISYLTKGTLTSPDVFTLIAGQNIDVGTVSVWNDGTILYVEYITTGGWKMSETHLYVGKTNPELLTSAPGQFPYSEEHDPAVIAYTYTIPMVDIDSYSLSKKGKKWVADNSTGIDEGDLIYIAAHAEASDGKMLNNPGAETGDMSGWIFIGPVRAIEFRHESTGDVLPRSGDYFFDMTASPAGYAEMSQELSVAGYDGVSFIANCWIQTELYPDSGNANITDNDYGELLLTFKDGFDAVLGTFTTGTIGNPVPGAGTTGYAQFDLTGNIPSGAVTVIYTLKGFLVGGSYVNVFYDDLSFEYWQEETAWAAGDRFSEQGNWATYFEYDPAVLIDTVTVGSDGTVSTSSFSLPVGAKYRLEVSGTYTYWPGQLPDAGIADAKYSLRPEGSHNPGPGPQWISGDDLGAPWTNYLELLVDGAPQAWGDFNLAHTYSMDYIGTGTPVSLNFNILDSAYGDNSGSLTVEIYQIP